MTEFIFLQGKSMWARTQRADGYGNWSINLRLDAKSLELARQLNEQGVKNRLRKDEDGYSMTFRRPTSKLIRGKVIGFNPPEVVDKEGKPVDVAIGNGSDVTVKVEVYTHGTPSGAKAKAARFAGVRIDNLVPFDKERDYDDGDRRKDQTEGLAEQPEQYF